MNRLLFAAARGARVQFYAWIGDDQQWAETTRIPIETPDYYRIHPDDLHLAYGPISTALREMATGDYEPSEYILAASGIANYLYPNWQYQWGEDRLHRSLFLLILSEALADSGL